MLTPLTNLEVLDLGFNQLGGNITAEVAAFIKLKQLGLARMGLEGRSLGTRTELYQNTRLFYSALHRPYPCRAFRLGQFEGAEAL